MAACAGEDGPAMTLRSSSVYDAGGGDALDQRDDAGMRDGGPADAGGDGDGDAGDACAPPLLQSFDIGSAAHVTDPVYNDPPPVGGPHTSCWLDYRVYAQAQDPGRWVHNLEHGGVVLLYNCHDDCPEEVDALSTFATEHPRTILTPYPELPTRFAVVAWGHRLMMDCLDPVAVQSFYDEHFNQAPEDIESGAPLGC